MDNHNQVLPIMHFLLFIVSVKNIQNIKNYAYNLKNLAANPEFAQVEKELKQAVRAEPGKSEDPRVVGRRSFLNRSELADFFYYYCYRIKF